VLQATADEGPSVPHRNARLTERGRTLLVERIRAGWTITSSALALRPEQEPGHPAALGASGPREPPIRAIRVWPRIC